jgi:putative sterol carrier protein
MERRNLLAGLAVLAVSLFVLSGTAFAHVAHHKKAKPREAGATSSAETCVVHAMPTAFMDQGEFGSASSIADVIEVECEEVYAEKYVRISANELYNRCDGRLYWRTPYGSDSQPEEWEQSSDPSFSVQLDNDGNATAVVVGGPSCAAGESLISAHLESPPFTTVVTVFTVLPPRVTKPGVYVTPETKVEGEIYSDVATIVQVEFPPVFAEEPVNVQGSQLYSRCKQWPHTEAITMNDEGYPETEQNVSEGTLYLDNDGNAFVVVIGNSSCAAGTSLIEASLENAPYTTYTANFTIEPPQPTFPN